MPHHCVMQCTKKTHPLSAISWDTALPRPAQCCVAYKCRRRRAGVRGVAAHRAKLPVAPAALGHSLLFQPPLRIVGGACAKHQCPCRQDVSGCASRVAVPCAGSAACFEVQHGKHVVGYVDTVLNAWLRAGTSPRQLRLRTGVRLAHLPLTTAQPLTHSSSRRPCS
jgi:hypothetical protein